MVTAIQGNSVQARWPDDVVLRLGGDSDIVLVLNSAGLSADEELADVIVGTSDHQGVAADSLILSNITSDGDILMLVNDGGISKEFLRANGDTADLQLGHGMATVTVKTDTYISDNRGLVIGHTAQINTGQTNELQVLGTGSADSRVTLGRWSADASSAAFQFVKSRNAAIGSSAIVNNDDGVFLIDALVDDGTDFVTSIGDLSFKVDDTSPAANAVGGAFRIRTATTGGALTEALRINNAQAIIASTNFTVGDTIITDGVITDATGLSIAAALDMGDNAINNIGVSGQSITSAGLEGIAGEAGNFWQDNTFSHKASIAGSQFMLLENTSTDSGAEALLRIRINTSSGVDPRIELTESGGNSWHLLMDHSQSDRFALGTGEGNTNNALRITQATPPVITYNSSHPTGTFDYVCDTCGQHSADLFTCCGPVEWHDDVMDFRAMALREPSALAYMQRVGVIELGYDEQGDPEEFTKLGPDFHFAMSAAFQNRERMDSLHMEHETRFSTVEDRVESLEEAQTILRDQIIALGARPEA